LSRRYPALSIPYSNADTHSDTYTHTHTHTVSYPVPYAMPYSMPYPMGSAWLIGFAKKKLLFLRERK
jgi:hypothetical protein